MPKTKQDRPTRRGHSGYLPGRKVKKALWGEILNLITVWVDLRPNPSNSPTDLEDAWEITSWSTTGVQLTMKPGDGGRRHYFTIKLTEHHEW